MNGQRFEQTTYGEEQKAHHTTPHHTIPRVLIHPKTHPSVKKKLCPPRSPHLHRRSHRCGAAGGGGDGGAAAQPSHPPGGLRAWSPRWGGGITFIALHSDRIFLNYKYVQCYRYGTEKKGGTYS